MLLHIDNILMLYPEEQSKAVIEVKGRISGNTTSPIRAWHATVSASKSPTGTTVPALAAGPLLVLGNMHDFQTTPYEECVQWINTNGS
jgi:hypothetical protein